MTKPVDIDRLQETLQYRFRDGAVLRRALTHTSALERVRRLGGSYQRLEFLGDRVLALVIADRLLAAFPKAPEGELARRLTALVRAETCADVAREIELGKYIAMSEGEEHSGGRAKQAILADVCEAVIGALFVDGGLEAAAAFIDRHWGRRLEEPAGHLRDAKTMLQEWAQARGLGTPTYRAVDRAGPDHRPFFTVSVELDGLEAAQGQGGSKRIAEQEAAAALLLREGVWTQEDWDARRS